MSTATTLITADEFAAMSFDRPVELLRGEIIEMTNPGGEHGEICFRLAGVLDRWLERHPEFAVASNDTGVLLEKTPDTVRGPDLLIIQRSKLPQRKFPQRHLTSIPDVVIEVRSPSDRTGELMLKVAMYLNAGVEEVWVVEPRHQRIQVFRDQSEATLFQSGDHLTSAVLPDFSLPLEKLFGDRN